MRFLFFLTAVLLLQLHVFAQDKTMPVFKVTKLISAQLPKTIRFKGKMVVAYRWKDKLGDNFLITSSFGPYGEKSDFTSDPGKTIELYTFHFLKKDSGYKLLWKITDAERACPFDITAEFIKTAIAITDLDKDGIAETTVQYLLSCRSDVSPAQKKLIMHEDTVKYALRGRMCEPGPPGTEVCVTEENVNLEKQPPAKEEWEEYSRGFGRYETEKDFKNAPKEFLVFARRQWLKFTIEK